MNMDLFVYESGGRVTDGDVRRRFGGVTERGVRAHARSMLNAIILMITGTHRACRVSGKRI